MSFDFFNFDATRMLGIEKFIELEVGVVVDGGEFFGHDIFGSQITQKNYRSIFADDDF